ncbi:hypothetical protein L7F22_047926 [Adiantum nelumboides]|nr:hypothetical protein [Adiantum nelumboides]
MVACVLATNGHGKGDHFAANVTAFLNAINGGDALEAQPTHVCIQFFQQFFSGTQVQTVEPVGPNLFGRIDVFEVNSTRTPDPNSPRLGVARGVLFYTSRGFPGYENQWTLTFTSESGLPANSSINFKGFEPSTEFFGQPYNYSVVGGTGAFACARGVVTESVFSSNATLEVDEDIACMVVGCGFNRQTDAFYLFSSDQSTKPFPASIRFSLQESL